MDQDAYIVNLEERLSEKEALIKELAQAPRALNTIANPTINTDLPPKRRLVKRG